MEKNDSLDLEKVEELGIDLTSFHEKRAGRLVIDPEFVAWRLLLVFQFLHVYLREAIIEFGHAVASKLKLSCDRTKVLWPQPTDSPLDPQNWSDGRKDLLLFIIILAAIVPDFDSGIGE